MRKLSCDPKLETVGSLMHVYINNLEADIVLPLAEKHGLTNIHENEWYPTHKLMEMLNELAESTNLGTASVAIGLSVGQTIPMPPELKDPTIHDILGIWNDLYQVIHRGGDAGHIEIQKISDTHYLTRHHGVVYPDDMSYGVLYGYGRRFLPGIPFKVYYDEKTQRLDDGGKYTDIHIEW
jgi:hypothetical protein